MTAVDQDIIDPVPNIFTFASGFRVKVVPMKTRQLFRLVRILTQGISASVGEGADLSVLFRSADQDESASQIIGLLVTAIPEAEDATVDFLESMVVPADLVEGRLSQSDRESNDELWSRLSAEIFNPEMEDLLGLVEIIIQQEVPSLVSLGKRLSKTIELMSKTGQSTTLSTVPSTPSTPKDLLEGSPSPSTSSRRSTAGAKKKS